MQIYFIYIYIAQIKFFLALSPRISISWLISVLNLLIFVIMMCTLYNSLYLFKFYDLFMINEPSGQLRAYFSLKEGVLLTFTMLLNIVNFLHVNDNFLRSICYFIKLTKNSIRLNFWNIHWVLDFHQFP